MGLSGSIGCTSSHTTLHSVVWRLWSRRRNATRRDAPAPRNVAEARAHKVDAAHVETVVKRQLCRQLARALRVRINASDNERRAQSINLRQPRLGLVLLGRRGDDIRQRRQQTRLARRADLGRRRHR